MAKRSREITGRDYTAARGGRGTLSGIGGLILVGSLAALAAALAWLRRVFLVGAAYKAKVLASALFVSGRDLDPENADEVSAEAYAPMQVFRARVDRPRRAVEVGFLGLFKRVAEFRPGLGTTLALRPLASAPVFPPTLAPRPASAPWPEGEAAPPAPTPALARVLDLAFAEPDPRKLRRTRAVLVVHGRRLVAERYAAGFGPAAPLPGWSMTKGVLGALVGTLVAEGRLALDAERLLKEWGADGDPRAAISLEDLLRMRSGLRFSEKYSDLGSDVNRMLWREPDAAAYAAARPLAHPPGTQWQYASGTSNLISLIARRTLGDEAYWLWPRRALFDPAGLSSAVLETDAAGTFVGSSFLHMTARDWARFGLLMLDDGVADGRRLLPAGWVEFLTTPTPQSPDGRYGAHWWLKLSKEFGDGTPEAARIPGDAYHALGHEGQCLTVIPSRGLVVLRLGLSIDVSAWNHAALLAGVLDAT